MVHGWTEDVEEGDREVQEERSDERMRWIDEAREQKQMNKASVIETGME